MANVNSINISITADGSLAITELNKVRNATKKWEGETGGIVSKIKAHWLGISAAIAGVMIIFHKAWSLAEMAAKYEEQKASLNSLAAQYGTSANQMIDNIQKVTNGLISMRDIVTISGEAMARHLSPDQIINLAKAAETLSNISGSASENFTDLTQAIATGRMRGLESKLGFIDLNEVLGKQAEKLTDAGKAHYMYAEVMKRVNKLQEQGVGATESLNDRMDRLRVTVDDLQLLMGTLLLRSIAGVVGSYYGLAASIMAVLGAREKLRAFVLKGELFSPEAEKKSQEATENAKIAFQMAYEYMDKQAEYFELVVTKSEDIAKRTTQIKKLSPSFFKPSDDTKKVIDDIKKLNQQLQDMIDKATLSPVAQIEKQAEEWRKAGVKKILIEQWVSVEMEKLNREHLLKITEENEQWEKQRMEDAKKKMEISEQEINLELDKIALAEKLYEISKSEAIEKSLIQYEKLETNLNAYLAAMDKAKDESAWYAQVIALEKVRQKIRELKFEAEEYSGTMLEGLKRGIAQYSRDLETPFQQGLEIIQQTTQAMESAFRNFFDYTSEGFMKFGKLAESILNDIYKALLEILIIQPLMRTITSGIGNLIGSASAITLTAPTSVPSYHFTGLPTLSYAGGGVAYRPAIFGEAGPEAAVPLPDGRRIPVELRGAQPNLNVVVNVENQTGAPVDAKQGQVTFDGENYIVNVILKNINQYGLLRHAIAGVK